MRNILRPLAVAGVLAFGGGMGGCDKPADKDRVEAVSPLATTVKAVDPLVDPSVAEGHVEETREPALAVLEAAEQSVAPESDAANADAASDLPAGVTETVKPDSGALEVVEGDFEKLVNFIESKGFVVKERGVKCDHQYTFFDSRGNRHALITIKRDENNQPSTTGTVKQISVWSYYDGIKDQEHFFGFRIDENEVDTFVRSLNGEWKEQEDVAFAYKEFLAKVTK